MALKNNLIVKQITALILPYIFIYAAYIQIFGEVAPGGGFQAGAVAASGFIAYDLAYGQAKRLLFSQALLLKLAGLGVMVYAATGIYSLVKGDNYLNYYLLPGLHKQALGIMLVELGVGLTVTSVLFLIYQEFKN